MARVAVDVPLAHLDRPFDYLVPATLDEAAVPGCRVRVRFAGRLTGGYLLERAEASDHQGTLAFLERVLSPEPVLTAEAAGLARAVADRYGGTLADVLRLAIPPRHARAEKAAPEAVTDTGADAGESLPPAPAPGPWERYPAGPSFLAALAGGRSPRAVWNALPGPDWPTEIALAAAATAASGRGTLIVVPDRRDLDAVHAALAALPAGIPHSCLSAELGPAERYRRWLAGLRGTATVVAGTRSAMFAPVPSLGLVVLWDDGDDLHAEPRGPYPHAREVLALRAHRTGAAALIGGFARTAEATQLVSGGWAHPLGADRATVRRFAPAIAPAGQDRELARDRPPAPPASLASRCAPSGTRWPAVPSCSRCRAAATWSRWPANGAGRPPGARPAAARWRWPAPQPCPPAGGAGGPRPAGSASTAGTPGSAPWSPAPVAPPKSWAGPSPQCRCAPRAAAACCTKCPPTRLWWWPPRALSRAP